MILTLLTNPIIISVVLMTLLCLFRFNVLLSLLISALIAGVFSHLELVDTMNILISGMKENLKVTQMYSLEKVVQVLFLMGNLQLE